MMNDGTSKINPNGNTMWLVCTAMKPSYGKAIREKVATLADALERARKWKNDNYTLRNLSRVKRCLVFVKGAALATVDPFADKVYRCDPVSEYSTGELLLDGAAYRAEVTANDEKRARAKVLFERSVGYRNECHRILAQGLVDAFGDVPNVFLSDITGALERNEFSTGHTVSVRRSDKISDAWGHLATVHWTFNSWSGDFSFSVRISGFDDPVAKLALHAEAIRHTEALALKIQELSNSLEFVRYLTDHRTTLKEHRELNS